MKLHFVKESCLETLRHNLNSNLKLYRNDTNEWVAKECGEEPFIEFKMEVPDFELSYDGSLEAGAQDVQNAITLYSALKGLTDTQATEERLWSGLCHGDFYGFLHKRWDMANLKKIESNEVATRYFFFKGQKRALFTNTLSRLWWCARLTYNTDFKDPFELTRYFADDFTTKMLMIFSNNYMANKDVVKGLILALQQLEKEGFALPNQKKKREVYYEATRYLNVLGGTCILDFFSAEEIHDKVLGHLKAL